MTAARKTPAARAPLRAKAIRGKPAASSAIARPARARSVPASDERAALSSEVKALRRLVDALEHAHLSFADTQLLVPRPEEYEPLLAPLREFARVSPALVEALREIVQATRPLAAMVEPLRLGIERLAQAGASLHAAEALRALALPAPAATAIPATSDEPPTPVDRLLAPLLRVEALRHVESARQAVRQALADLPRHSDYAPVAAQLRELATVSPSLMEWLKEIPKVTTPLARSVAALRQAQKALEAACDLLGDAE